MLRSSCSPRGPTDEEGAEGLLYCTAQHQGPRMLYQIYEAQRSLMEPFADFAQAAAKLYSNPLTPFGQNPLAQRASAGYELMYRLWKDYEKPAFGIQSVEIDGHDVVIHESVELDKPFCELRRFKRFSDDPDTLAKLKSQPTVLVVAPLSG